MHVMAVPADKSGQAAAVLTQAFLNDPAFAALWPDPTRRRRILTRFNESAVRMAPLTGRVLETTPTVTAVSMWSPPGHTTTPLVALRSLPGRLRVRTAMPRTQASRWLDWQRRQDQRRHQLVPEPHWVLDVVGVQPDRQRFGLGAILVRHGLRRAADDHVPVYVETCTEANYAFYMKFGLELVEYVADEPPMNLPTWRMVRAPA